MDKKILVEVNGGFIRKDSDVAGFQGEANATIMNIIFDEGWDGYAKKITFWDALGENPVERTLTTDLLTDITVSTLDYSVPIPGEPLVHQGTMTFVIDGFADGVRKRSASDKLKVKYSPMADTAEEPADPTPTQAEQLQKQIDTMLDDMQAERILAEEAKNTAVNAAEDAVASRDATEVLEASASARANEAINAAKIAVEAQENIEANANRAEAAADDAEQSAQTAVDAKNTAVESGNSASLASASAQSFAAEAKTSATEAKQASQSASTSATAAGTSERNASASAASAETSATNAKASEEAAIKAKEDAEKIKDSIGEIAGGDFATKTEAKDYADTAEENANKYTDEQIAKIPTPDVSGQIEEHNQDEEAHPYIQELIETLGTRLNTIANSTDEDLDQIAELVAYIKDNRSLIEQVTTGKVSVSDIVNNLTSTATNKPLSAAQGKVLKDTVDDHAESITNLGSAISANTEAISKKAPQTDVEALEAQITQLQAQLADKAPMYTYGTEDLEAGVSPLETGRLHFVYEA